MAVFRIKALGRARHAALGLAACLLSACVGSVVAPTAHDVDPVSDDDSGVIGTAGRDGAVRAGTGVRDSSVRDGAVAVSSDAGTHVVTPTGALLHGFYHLDAPGGPGLQDAIASWLGNDHELANAYPATDSWADLAGPSWQLPAWGKWVAAKAGRRLVYAIALMPGGSTGAGPDGQLGTGDDVSLQQCSDGKYNATWTMLANNLVSAGLGTAALRPGWEFNGNWTAWSASGKEAQFVGCFRQVVMSMRTAQPSASFEFNWNPTNAISSLSTAQINALWPGDEYVDSIGVDAYDQSWVTNSYPYPASCDASCRSTHQQNAWNDVLKGLNLLRDMALAHGKPLTFPEWGVWTRNDSHGGGDNPQYIENMFNYFNDPANHVGWEVLFDTSDGDGQHQLSDVSSASAHGYTTMFPNAAAKFKTLFGAP